MKKLLALILAATLVFSLSIFVFAEGETVTDAPAATDTAPAGTEEGENTEQPSAWQQFLSVAATFLPIVLIVVVFYFLMIRPQKKQEKKTQEMRSSITIGDQVTTIGGITGIVRQIKDDDIFIIETGADKNRISIRKWAIQSKDTISE